MRLKKAKKFVNVDNPSMELSRKEKLMSPPFFDNYSEVPPKLFFLVKDKDLVFLKSKTEQLSC